MSEGFEEARRRIAEVQATGATTLDLNGLRLTTLPDELWHLTWLEELDVGYSEERELTDAIQDWGNLANNQLLELPSALGYLKALRVLKLRYNRLASLPTAFGELTALETLDLSNNQFAILPYILRRLPTLLTLNLSHNYLTSLDEGIGQLTVLQTLDLSHNCLTDLPNALGRLTALQMLDLSSNQLASLPAALGQLTALQKLNLGVNKLTSLPDALGELTALEWLFLNFNDLTHLPTTLGQLGKLEELYLAGNQLTHLPHTIGDLWRLRKLKVGDALLHMTFTFSNPLVALPAGLRTLARLEELDLVGTALPLATELLASTTEPRRLLDAYFAVATTSQPVHERVEATPAYKVLALFVNAFDTETLAQKQEWGVMQAALSHDLTIDIDPQLAPTGKVLRQRLEDFAPQFLYVSGHGSERGLDLVGPQGNTRLMEWELFVELLNEYTPPLELLVLNVCHADHILARAPVIPTLITQSGDLPDKAALDYMEEFCRIFAKGRDVKKAHRAGKLAMRDGGYIESLPTLHER